jgi:hypothetical protein
LRLTLPQQRGQLAHGQLLGVAQGEQAQAIFIAQEAEEISVRVSGSGGHGLLYAIIRKYASMPG